MAIKRKYPEFNGVHLTETVVNNLLSACCMRNKDGSVKRDADGSVSCIKQQLTYNKMEIRFLLGQLDLVHQDITEHEQDSAFFKRYDGENWTNSILADDLLNLGAQIGCVSFCKKDDKLFVRLIDVKPTFSPEDSRFAAWFEENGMEFKAEYNFERGLSAYDKGNYGDAFMLYTKAAEQGNASAQFNCGSMYSEGNGAAVDKAKALYWYEKAAEQGVVDAQYICGKMYHDGVGTAVDKTKAHMWYEKAAEQGHTEAQYIHGMSYHNVDSVKELHWLEKAAEQGHAKAQLFTGLMYYRGNGTAVDYAKALCWFEKAAERGNSLAQSMCGDMYNKGEGTVADDAKALYWYEKAAEQGEAAAQFNCGAMYYNGEGTVADEAKALYWYEKAAEQGNIKAQFMCGGMYYEGEGISKDKTKARAYFQKAADQKEDTEIRKKAKKLLRKLF